MVVRVGGKEGVMAFSRFPFRWSLWSSGQPARAPSGILGRWSHHGHLAIWQSETSRERREGSPLRWEEARVARGFP